MNRWEIGGAMAILLATIGFVGLSIATMPYVAALLG